MELLAASFDWDASLRDPSAALAYLGRKPEEKLDYEERSGWGLGWEFFGVGEMGGNVGGVGREFLQWLSEKSVLITSRQILKSI